MERIVNSIRAEIDLFKSRWHIIVNLVKNAFVPGAFKGCALTISDSFHEFVASIVLGFNVEIASLLKESTRRYLPENKNQNTSKILS